METVELKKVAQIIYNKIQNENIKFYEKAAYGLGEYEGNNYVGRELLAFEISLLDIEKSIKFQEDLNFLNGIDMKRYLDVDLNDYLMKVLFMRQNKMSAYMEVVETASMEMLPFLLVDALEYFTFEESLQLQTAFLKKRIFNQMDTEWMTEEVVLSLFYPIMQEFKMQKEEELLQRTL